MRIVQLGKYYPPYAGGIENNTRHCALELAKEHDVQVLVFNQGRQTTEEVVDGIPVVRVGSLGRIARQEVAPAMARYLRRMKPDVIHLHAPNPLATLAYLIATPGVPIVVTHHTDIIKQRLLKPLVMPMYRQVLQRSEAVILYTNSYGVTSPELRQFHSRFAVIPHGTDETPFQPNAQLEQEAAQFRQRLTNGSPSAFFLGRHVYYKGIEVLLRALTHARDVHAFIGGDGPLYEHHQHLAQGMGLEKRAHFLGRMNAREKAIAYYASDFCVLPSLNRTESYGQVQVEAQLCRRPVIVSDLDSGTGEVTRHEQTGLLVPPGNALALAAAMQRLAGDPQLRQRFGEAGYQRARSTFVETVTGPMLRSLFKEIETGICNRNRLPSLGASQGVRDLQT